MKITKRAILILLSLLMIVTAVPISVLAVDDNQAKCEIDGIRYANLSEAIKYANRSRKDVTITLNGDVEWTTMEQSINATRGDINVTIDGNGYKVTTIGDTNVFDVRENLILKNIVFVHNASGSLLQIRGDVDVTFDNVIVDASAVVGRKYTLINAMGSDNLIFKNTDIVLRADLSQYKNAALSAIRTGNGKNTVSVTMTDCNIDVAGEGTAHGIHVYAADTVADINLTNTNIKAGLGDAIFGNTNAATKIKITGGILETSRKKYDNTASDDPVKKFYPAEDPEVVSGKTAEFTPASPSVYIVGYQDTSATAAPFDVRFIAAASKSAYEQDGFSLNMSIYVANVTAGDSDKTYNSSELVDKVATNGGMSEFSKANYKFATLAYNGSVQGSGVYAFKVELSYTLNGIKHSAGTATATYVDGKCQTFDYTIDLKDLSGRYLLVSDLHYVAAIRDGQTDTNRVTYRGTDSEGRLNILIKAIKEEKAKRGLDAVYVLGDVTTDDWYDGCTQGNATNGSVWLPLKNGKYPIVYVYEQLTAALDVPVYFIAGNHDSYYQSMWAEIFANVSEKTENTTKRQYTVAHENGDVFIMLDTFGGADNDATAPNYNGAPDPAGGSNYTGVDIQYLREQLELHKDKKNVFLCSHEFDDLTNEMKVLLEQYDNVVCMFEGHTHHYSGSGSYGGMVQLINTGNFAYGNFDDSIADKPCSKPADCNGVECLWGFQIVETSADNVVSYRVNVAHTYTYADTTKNREQPYVKFADIILK